MVETVITIALASLGFLGGGAAWFYKRGKSEQVLSTSVDRNTEATTELAAQVGGLRVTLEAHSATLTEHHFRLKALEEKEVRVIVK